MTDHVTVMDEAGVRLVTLSRPERRNALTQAMYDAVIRALEGADSDPMLRVTVLTGAGDFFTSGNDLADFAGQSASREGSVQIPD